MADIFISYAKKDRESVEPLGKALAEQGWSVFWDRAIPGGKTWDEVIEEELDAAKCVIVVWSKISITSRWVRAEAEEGLKKNILVPVSIEDVKIPLLFRPIQSVRLIKWQEDSNHPQFVKLISDLSPILGPSPKKVKETEQLRAEEERKREQEQERKLREEEQKHIEAARKAEKERKQEQEQKRKAEEERRRKEREELKRKPEEERKRKQAETKRKADEERESKEIKSEIKPEKPELSKASSPKTKLDETAIAEPKPPQPIPPEPRRSSVFLKFGVLAGVAVLLIFGIKWYISDTKNVEHRTATEVVEKSKPQKVITKPAAVAIKAGTEEGSIDLKTFSKILEENPQSIYLVDVRDPDEFAAGHFQTAVNIPVGELEEKVATLPTDKPIVFVCSTGAISGESYYILQDIKPELKTVYYLDAEVEYSKDGSYKIKISP